ncbi:MAG: enoyl-CoA hydratase [Gammaproteobacteria bacterium]|jgi:enoyl-CoA hydratase|nr:enoyl-CoA hydratase [Gammaproteobacteria bacterium]
MSYQNVLTELDQDGILSITLNRADKLNALSAELLAELLHVLDQAHKDPQTYSLLITGAGKAFCAGADIRRLAELDANSAYEFARDGQRVFDRLENLGKPSLAAVNGFCFGGGCELAMATTIRFASIEARFAQPEVKLGVIPGFGGTQRLPRLVGKGRALDMCLSGRTVAAEEAHAWGLVNALHSGDTLLAAAKDYLRQLRQLAPIALQRTLEAIHQGYNLSLADALQLEALLFAQSAATKDKAEGVAAFLEKRAAKFVGK